MPEMDGYETMREIRKNARFRTLPILALPEVHGDAATLRQVLANLLDNALKFTRPRLTAQIEIGSITEPDADVVFVRDNGVGFDPRYAERLFGVFQRMHSREEFEGTGIGLATVQRLMHRHGGRTWAEIALGRGRRSIVRCPARARSTTRPRQRNSHDESLGPHSSGRRRRERRAIGARGAGQAATGLPSVRSQRRGGGLGFPVRPRKLSRPSARKPSGGRARPEVAAPRRL